jgi:hypothetical protein
MKKIVRTLAALSSLVILTSCASLAPALPEGYTGPTAVLKDSAKLYTASKADMFYALMINGDKVDNTLFATRAANAGRGRYMTVKKFERKVAAGVPLKLNLNARTHYAAPIMALTSTVYAVEGDVSFTPEAGKTYVVRGQLGETYSAVWVEEETTKEVVGQKIELNGAAKPGLPDK